MTPEQIRDLALALYTVIFGSGDMAEPKALRDRCIRICRSRGLDPIMTAIISEALTGYVYCWSSGDAHLMTQVPKAQKILNLAMGEDDAAVGRSRPAGARLAPYAIADMIGWVLTSA